MDRIFADVRSVMRGEAAGSVRFAVLFFAAAVIWLSVWQVWVLNSGAQSRLKSAQDRFGTLLTLADEYKSLSPRADMSGGNIDVAAVFAAVSEAMSLGSRVNRITPDGRNQSVEINRLYAEELAELQKQLSSRGVKFIAAEIRAMPSGKERLLTVSAIIGPSK